LKTEEKFTISLVIANLRGMGWWNPYHLIMAGCVVATFPLLAVFFALQRHFVAGAVSGALKM